MKEEFEEEQKILKEVEEQKAEIISVSTITQLRDSFAQDFEMDIDKQNATSPPKIGSAESILKTERNEEEEGSDEEAKTVKFEQRKRSKGAKSSTANST